MADEGYVDFSLTTDQHVRVHDQLQANQVPTTGSVTLGYFDTDNGYAITPTYSLNLSGAEFIRTGSDIHDYQYKLISYYPSSDLSLSITSYQVSVPVKGTTWLINSAPIIVTIPSGYGGYGCTWDMYVYFIIDGNYSNVYGRICNREDLGGGTSTSENYYNKVGDSTKLPMSGLIGHRVTFLSEPLIVYNSYYSGFGDVYRYELTKFTNWLQTNATKVVINPFAKIGDLPIVKKMFGDLQVVKEVVNGITIWEDEIQVVPYLTFSSPNSFTLGVYNTTKNWDGTLEYSTDTETWTTWDGTSALSSASDGTNYNIYLRGTSNTYITGKHNYANRRFVLTGSSISCLGNIETLLDYATVELGNHPTMANYCFYNMFDGCSSLIKAPELKATTLTANCYCSMFDGCTSLTAAPNLPATTLEEACYYHMFNGCSSLINAPVISANTLAYSCCNGMFEDCTALVIAPSLPATTLARECYDRMFQGCTSLIEMPELPATTLAIGCYENMFNRCSSLKIIHGLPSTTLANGCYQYMFSNCTSLEKIPSLPTLDLPESCYKYMFLGCTKIKISETQDSTYKNSYRLPTIGQGTAVPTDAREIGSLDSMFRGTGGTFTGTPTINTTYYTSNDIIN